MTFNENTDMKTNNLVCLLIGCAGALLLSCSKQEPTLPDNGRVSLSAAVGKMDTRVSDGAVVDGTYYLTYYATPDRQAVCMVPFANSAGYPLVTNTTGIYQFLKWRDISLPATGSSYLFTLDNIANETETTSLPLGEDYRAAALNASPEVDIVWGRETVAAGAENNSVDFTLSHRMSKISLEISVNSSNIVLADKNVKISFINVVDQPATFNRSSGAVSVGSNAMTEVVLHEGKLIQDGSKYILPSSWIFPPQTFKTDNWPKLRIELDGTVYEGPLNHYMINVDEDADTPVAMTGLNAGRHLTLRASLSETAGDVELIFMPVWIKKWEEIDNIGITAKQCGVYAESDYLQLVEAYNQDPKDEKALQKFGTLDLSTNRWTFILYKNIGDATGAAGMPKFKDGDFEMSFNGYTVYGYNTKDDLVN